MSVLCITSAHSRIAKVAQEGHLFVPKLQVAAPKRRGGCDGSPNIAVLEVDEKCQDVISFNRTKNGIYPPIGW
jgi:hypothetical protein